MIDFILGLWLWFKYVMNKYASCGSIWYTCCHNGRYFMSDKPFGSKWLTKRSRVWMPRTKRGKKSIQSSNGLMFDDCIIRTKDAVEIDNTCKYVFGLLE